MAVCASCGHESPADARFCSACGHSLGPTADVREVRKTVTVVFTDIAGSTSLGERLDPEAVRRVMSRYFEATSEVLKRHGGTVEKFIGDSVMAVFGSPTVHEDDALRAVRAAADLRGSMAALNVELQHDWGVDLGVRTGVNTGEVVAGDSSTGHGIVTGDCVNVAKRLEQTARTGEILIGDATLRLVRDAVAVEPVEPLELKGKANPVLAWRLLAVIEGAPGVARRLDSPIVGRSFELTILNHAFERSERERTCHLFTVLGAAGVGKTRLASEFLDSLEGRARWVRGRCLPYGEGITFWPLDEIVRDVAKLRDGLTLEEKRNRIAELLADAEDAPVIVDRIAASIGLGGDPAAAEETFWAARKLFESLARERPLVVVFEDIHWAEPTMLDLIEHLADWSRDAPIMILCLSRAELLDARPSWGGGKLNATAISLGPLSDSDCGELMANLLGRSEIPVELGMRIAESAGGNPLFVEEMIGMLIDDDLLRQEGGHWVPAGDLSSISVPPTIQALLAARLDRLTTGERAVVESASVIGKVFWRGAVAALTGTEVDDALQTLVRKELIRPEPPTLTGEDEFRFRHILICDCAYQALPKESRSTLHERFVDWLEDATAERSADQDEIVGYHLEQASRYRSELGVDDERTVALATAAAERLAAAGRRAFARFDSPAAANLLERAVELLPREAPARLEASLDLSYAFAEVGRLKRAVRLLDETIEIAAAVGDSGLEARAQLRRCRLRTNTDPEGSSDASREAAERAIPLFERTGNELGLAEAYQLLAYVEVRGHQIAAAERLLDRALVYAQRIGNKPKEDGILSGIASATLWGPMRVDDGIRRCDEILERIKGNLVEEASCLMKLAALHAMRADFDRARTLVGKGRRMLEELGLGYALSRHSQIVGLVELVAGEPAAAEQALRAGYEDLQRTGDRHFVGTVAALLAHALERLDRLDEAEEFAEISAGAAATDDFVSQLLWRSARAKALAHRGEYEAAESLARHAATIAAGTDDLRSHGDALMDLVQVLMIADRRSDAAPYAEQALELYERKGVVPAAARARALVVELVPA